MAQNQLKPSYIPAYDGLRFFLLICVIEYHYSLGKIPVEKFWILSLSLPCFFVLSGFLITQLLLKTENQHRGYALLKFYARRSLRIFPAYYFVLIGAALINGIPHIGWYASYLINYKMFYVSAFGTAENVRLFFTNWSADGMHLWSMAIEEQFYLLFPLILLFAPAKWRTRILSLAILSCLVLRIWFLLNHPSLYYGALLPISGEYILWGCLFAWLDHQKRLTLFSGHGALVCAAIVFTFLCWLEQHPERYEHGVLIPSIHLTGYAVCMSVLLLVLRHNTKAWYSKFLALRPFTAMGKISYSAYLLHLFLNPLVDKILLEFPALILFEASPRAIAGPIVSLGFASLMWWSFEKRLNDYKDVVSSKIDRLAKNRVGRKV